MTLDPAASARVEAAYDAAQGRARAPLVCVLASASASHEAEFLLGACILALLAPLPLLLFTELSAHRIYILQLAVAVVAAAIGSTPWARRWLIPKRAARSAAHRAALAQFTLRGLDRSQCGALVYVSLAEHYIRIVAAEEATRKIPHERWQAAVDAALGPLAAGRTEEALTDLAAGCGELLAASFPPDPDWRPPPRQRFHRV
jgi:putative membrane protein